MTRGDVVIVRAKGSYTGKARPAVVVQSDLFTPTHASVTLCPVTSDCVDAPLFRVALPPGARTGLSISSQIMVDKVVTVPLGNVERTVGRCDSDEIGRMDEALRLWLDL